MPSTPATGTRLAGAAIVAGVMSVACGPAVVPGGADGSSTTSGPLASASSPQTTAPGPTRGATTSYPSTTTFDTESEASEVETGACFLCPPPATTTGPKFGCDTWLQDCPEDEKCVAWANDGGNFWNHNKCAPLDPNPDQVGDQCSVEGSGYSGLDTCDKFSMCLYVDTRTNIGECVALCQGSEDDPICDDPAQSCFIDEYETLNICLDRCDPIAQSCDEPQACVLYFGESFCLPVGHPELVYGDRCFDTNACPAGLVCVPGDSVPSCDEWECCTQYCDPSLPTADESCPDFDQGQTCVAVEGTPYGVCAVEP